MKKLTNVSPFLLLLFPVLLMMILAFATNNATSQGEEVASKTSAPANTIVKATAAISK